MAFVYDFPSIQPYNDIDKKMLESFYEYVREHRDADWVHWNMRDINYGFVALI